MAAGDHTAAVGLCISFWARVALLLPSSDMYLCKPHILVLSGIKM